MSSELFLRPGVAPTCKSGARSNAIPRFYDFHEMPTYWVATRNFGCLLRINEISWVVW